MTEDEFIKWEKNSRDTIDVKRIYIDIAGGLVAGILLSQIIYWFLPSEQRKTKLRAKYKGELCLAKNRDEWWKECRISKKQFDRAIKILEKKNFVTVYDSLFNGKRTPHIFLEWDNVIREIEKLDNKFDLTPTDETDNWL